MVGCSGSPGEFSAGNSIYTISVNASCSFSLQLGGSYHWVSSQNADVGLTSCVTGTCSQANENYTYVTVTFVVTGVLQHVHDSPFGSFQTITLSLYGVESGNNGCNGLTSRTYPGDNSSHNLLLVIPICEFKFTLPPGYYWTSNFQSSYVIDGLDWPTCPGGPTGPFFCHISAAYVAGGQSPIILNTVQGGADMWQCAYCVTVISHVQLPVTAGNQLLILVGATSLTSGIYPPSWVVSDSMGTNITRVTESLLHTSCIEFRTLDSTSTCFVEGYSSGEIRGNGTDTITITITSGGQMSGPGDYGIVSNMSIGVFQVQRGPVQVDNGVISGAAVACTAPGCGQTASVYYVPCQAYTSVCHPINQNATRVIITSLVNIPSARGPWTAGTGVILASNQTTYPTKAWFSSAEYGILTNDAWPAVLSPDSTNVTARTGWFEYSTDWITLSPDLPPANATGIDAILPRAGSVQNVGITNCDPIPTGFLGDGIIHYIMMTHSCVFTLTLPAGYYWVATGHTSVTGLSCSGGTCAPLSFYYAKTPNNANVYVYLACSWYQFQCWWYPMFFIILYDAFYFGVGLKGGASTKSLVFLMLTGLVIGSNHRRDHRHPFIRTSDTPFANVYSLRLSDERVSVP